MSTNPLIWYLIMYFKMFLSFFNRIVYLAAMLVTLSSCAVYEIQETEPLNPSERWVMLPLLNHSDTPEAGKRAADIAATLLRTKGIVGIEKYMPSTDNNLLELNQQKQYQDAVNWASQNGYRYVVSGSVQEWRYKSGLDAEPVAGITLSVTDLTSKQVIWSASGSRTGWGRDSVSGVAHKLMSVLIDGLDLSY